MQLKGLNSLKKRRFPPSSKVIMEWTRITFPPWGAEKQRGMETEPVMETGPVMEIQAIS